MRLFGSDPTRAVKKGHSLRTKVIVIFSVIVLAVIMIFVLIWVQSRSAREMKKDVISQLEQMDDLMVQQGKEALALIAIKNGVDEAVLANILSDYFTVHELGYKFRQQLIGESTGTEAKPKPLGNMSSIYKNFSGLRAAEIKPAGTENERAINLNFARTIRYLSRRYNIPQEKLAGMILEYRMMTAVNKGDIVDTLITGKTRESLMRFSIKGLLGHVKKLQ